MVFTFSIIYISITTHSEVTPHCSNRTYFFNRDNTFPCVQTDSYLASLCLDRQKKKKKTQTHFKNSLILHHNLKPILYPFFASSSQHSHSYFFPLFSSSSLFQWWNGNSKTPFLMKRGQLEEEYKTQPKPMFPFC